MAKEQIQIAITDADITVEQRRNKTEIAARYQEIMRCKMQASKVILYVQAKSIFLVGTHLSYLPVRCTLIGSRQLIPIETKIATMPIREITIMISQPEIFTLWRSDVNESKLAFPHSAVRS